MSWAIGIPLSDSGWRQISLSAKPSDGGNVRFSPITTTTNNIAGRILHESVNGKLKGIANPNYVYEDDTYIWYPVLIFGGGFDQDIQVWIATNVFVYELGDFVNVSIPAPDSPVDEPQFYDLSLPGYPTIHILPEHLSTVVEVLHAVANYLHGLSGTK